MDRNIATMRIARDLSELEVSLNKALACASALTHSIAVGRQIDGVAFSSGQESMVRLAAIQQLLTKSATETVRVHRDLLRSHEKITGIADSNGDCPKFAATLTDLKAA